MSKTRTEINREEGLSGSGLFAFFDEKKRRKLFLVDVDVEVTESVT
jgi:hypothetical protein